MELMIEEHVDRFERQQSIKRRKVRWRKTCSVPKKVLRAFPDVLKTRCKTDPHPVKAQPKKFRYDRYPQAPPMFTCDREYPRMEEEQRPAKRRRDQRKRWHLVCAPERLRPEELSNFSAFRHRFYNSRHEQIKLAFASNPFIRIYDIRPAPIDPSVQNYFMQTLRTYPHFPELVYHGTEMSSMENIFRYGLMIPHQRHPIFADAPIVKSRIGRAYGEGIYCTHQALRALENLHETNTILVCAALPKRHGPYSTLAHSFGDILVLKDESRIIPLFLLDVQHLRHIYPNHPWYDYEKTVVFRRKKPERRTSNSISLKYLRKVLDRINSERRNSVRQWLDD